MTRPALDLHTPSGAHRLGNSLVALAAALVLGGCTNLAPELKRPALPVPATLPATPASQTAPALMPAWRELLLDDRLRQVVDLALAHNRDLRVAWLNVERSRAQLNLADADRWPSLSAAAAASRAPNAQGQQGNSLQAGLQLSSYEVDLLGRVRNANDAAAASLLATQAAQRGTQLGVLTQTVAAWLALVADGEQMSLARQTLANRNQTLELTSLRQRVGAVSDIELNAARSLSAAARATVAQLERQAAQDRQSLDLLAGQVVPDNLLPQASDRSEGPWLATVPAGLSTDALLLRPDVIQAEQTLAATNANIGVARAAMFPRLTLGANAGQASNTLAGLFRGSNFVYTLSANAVMSLFDAGRNQANIRVAEVNRDVAVAQYEKAVQTAYREAADALQAQATWGAQRQAQQELLDAEQHRLRLTRMKLQQGVASLNELLDAERQQAAAQQVLVQVRLAEVLNRLALYKALGGESQ